jgi:hypothetical protein
LLCRNLLVNTGDKPTACSKDQRISHVLQDSTYQVRNVTKWYPVFTEMQSISVITDMSTAAHRMSWWMHDLYVISCCALVSCKMKHSVENNFPFTFVTLSEKYLYRTCLTLCTLFIRGPHILPLMNYKKILILQLCEYGLWLLPVLHVKLYIVNFSLNIFLEYSGFEHQIVEMIKWREISLKFGAGFIKTE